MSEVFRISHIRPPFAAQNSPDGLVSALEVRAYRVPAVCPTQAPRPHRAGGLLFLSRANPLGFHDLFTGSRRDRTAAWTRQASSWLKAPQKGQMLSERPWAH